MLDQRNKVPPRPLFLGTTGQDSPSAATENAGGPAGQNLPAQGEQRDRIATLLAGFLAGKSERTIRAYWGDLEDFRAFVNLPTLDAAANRLLSCELGEANALAAAYKVDLLARGLSASTTNRRLAALRSLVKLARTFGVVSWSLDVENVKTEPYRDTRSPGRKGVKSLLAALEKRRDKKAVRDAAIVHLLHDLALRRGEVVSLDIDDVDLAAGTVAVTGKGRRQKVILTLPASTKAALARWIALRGGAKGPLFTNLDRAKKGEARRLSGTSLYRIVRALGEAAGVRVTPQGLRHTAITEACRAAQAAGVDLEEVLDFSRHTDVKVLMIYRDRERDVQGLLAELVSGDV